MDQSSEYDFHANWGAKEPAPRGVLLLFWGPKTPRQLDLGGLKPHPAPPPPRRAPQTAASPARPRQVGFVDAHPLQVVGVPPEAMDLRDASVDSRREAKFSPARFFVLRDPQNTKQLRCPFSWLPMFLVSRLFVGFCRCSFWFPFKTGQKGGRSKETAPHIFRFQGLSMSATAGGFL